MMAILKPIMSNRRDAGIPSNLHLLCARIAHEINHGPPLVMGSKVDTIANCVG